MTLRYLVVVLLLATIGAGLLGMRQQQLNDKHAIAESHTQMKSDREQIKDLQVRIAKQTTPEALQDAIHRSKLNLEPMSKRPTDQNPQADPDEQEPRDG